MSAHVQDVLTLVLMGGAALYLARRLFAAWTGTSAGSCGGCNGCASRTPAKASTPQVIGLDLLRQSAPRGPDASDSLRSRPIEPDAIPAGRGR